MDEKIQYQLGYDAGFQDGRHHGYVEGAEDTMVEYETRIAKLTADIRILEARVNVLGRRSDER